MPQTTISAGNVTVTADDSLVNRSGFYERRSFPAEELRVLDAEGGPQIQWYPALFNSRSEDLGGFVETIARRAFNKTVRDADVRALFNHNPDYVLGRNKAGTLELSVTDKGLRATVNPPETQWASDLMGSIKRGDISGGSFGFRVVKDEWTPEGTGFVRELQEVQLFDVSLVTYPAYPETNGNVALRTAFRLAGVTEADLVNPLLRVTAGLALEPDERGRYMQAIECLRSSIPTPEPVYVGVPLSLRKHQLELLAMKRRD